MTPPIRLRGCWFQVEVVPSLDNDVGHCDLDSYTIRIVSGHEQQMRTTLFHEVIHAACPSLSEKTVLMIERKLFSVLNDNPELRKTLFGT